MAEEPKPEVAVEQEAAATNGDGDAGAKSGKSFEERLAELKMPEAVPQPKEDEVNAQLSKLNSEITTWDKRLTEIKSAIEKAGRFPAATRTHTGAPGAAEEPAGPASLAQVRRHWPGGGQGA